MQQAKFSLVALAVLAVASATCCSGAQFASDSDNLVVRADSDRLTPEQVAQLLTTIADNQQKSQSGQGKDQATSDESYQRVYESVARLVRTMSQNNLSNMRRFVSRLNVLVGGQSSQPSTNAVREQEEKTDQILDRLDNVKPGQTDSHSIRQLNDDINKFVSTLSDSYLRNIRRVIERMNKVIGAPAPGSASGTVGMYANGADSNAQSNGAGFPGWDEFMVAFDRIQKSLAQFVRSSTRLAISG